jgi:DNA-binding NtrC family response regulator
MSSERKIVPFPPTAGRPATVLVVDDEPGVRQLLTHWVNSLGYTSRMAGDSAAALEVMKSTPINVAVCDIRMPGHDGVWLIDRIRKEFPATAVIIATGMPDLAPTVTQQPGVAGYLIKPFERRDLATVLSQALMSDAT